MSRVVIRVHPVLEKVEQAHIIRLLRSMGGEVFTLGTRRPKGLRCHKCGTVNAESQGTRQTPGLPDLLCFLRRPHGQEGRDCVVIECKRKGGKLSDDQRNFQALCSLSGVAHVVGTLDDVIRWLIEHQYLNAGQVGHYHQ